MNRNDIVTLDKLKQGDRFYKQGDAKKNVMKVLNITHDVQTNAVKRVFIVPADKPVDWYNTKEVKSPANYTAVFLRSEIEVC